MITPDLSASTLSKTSRVTCARGSYVGIIINTKMLLLLLLLLLLPLLLLLLIIIILTIRTMMITNAYCVNSKGGLTTSSTTFV